MDEYYIIGKFKKIIYQNDSSNYVVTLFRVLETNEPNIQKEIHKLINVTGILPSIKLETKYRLNGTYLKHPKYSWQFAFTSFEVIIPSTKDAIFDFLSSSFVVGCGEITARNIINVFGDKTLEKIKEDVNNLLLIPGMTSLRAMKIYNSVIKFDEDNNQILFLQKLGFSIDDTSKILNKHHNDFSLISEGNIYLLKDIFDFKKLDDIYINNFGKDSDLRCKECILESMMQISFNEGSTYYFLEDIYKALKALFNIEITNDKFMEYLESLINESEIIIQEKRFYLTKYYYEEEMIANTLYKMSKVKSKNIENFEEKILKIEETFGIKYNDEQKSAIKKGLENNISIISGGPGTGKTTIIKAIIKLYLEENNIKNDDINTNIALLAPTGRASKKLSLATGIDAYTIHRHLKWHKESDTFEYDENHKLSQKLIIVDESSMVDVSLMKSLLSALYYNTHLILVGDIYQLPSVGPGNVLHDIIESDYFSFTPLNIIYRQSDNSYIPFLAKDIKMQNIDEEFMYKRDDYNFIICSEDEIMNKIISSVKYGVSKGINEDSMQILAPMYKGANGIDNLNYILKEIYNPKDINKLEVKYGDVVFRENDKVLQLINDSDNNVFNGDIGKILSIREEVHKKVSIRIDFDGNIVNYQKKDLKNITHAYAMTIHKSQGSEFEHVIMPICKKYYIMLYNKLLYTGVSRAKKSLTIIGDPQSFITAIKNNYASERKTSLKDFLKNNFEK